jgi:transposase
MLTESIWIKINSILKKLNFDKFNVHLYQGNIRIFIEAVLWKLRTGAPWRDLPSEFGPYSSIFNRFNRWSKIGLWKELFNNANSV